MKAYYITGANGHLGGTLVRLLEGTACQVAALVLPSELAQVRDHQNIRYFAGDVTRPETLMPFFQALEPGTAALVHAAGLVDIGDLPLERLRQVNVEGTKNILALCRRFGVGRIVYVSSVHAIPRDPGASVMTEIGQFSPEAVSGSYAKTKAEATQAVLDAAADGLDAVVVHPSGIIGPYNGAGNHLVQMIRDYMLGKLPACVKGGYDMVDVRDVAQGCLNAAERGKRGECYILSNRRYDIREVLRMVRANAGGRRLPVLPIWLAKAFAPLLAGIAKLRGQRPLYTRYSLAVLDGCDRFSHDKATQELFYRPRDLSQTIADTVSWLKQSGCRAGRRMRPRARLKSLHAVK